MRNELSEFQQSFTKLQKAMIINALYVVTYADSQQLHPNEIESIELTAKNLDIKINDSIFNDLLPPDTNKMFSVLNTLDSSQKEWVVMAIRYAVVSDGPTKEIEMEASQYIFKNIGISDEKVIEIIKKSDALFSSFYETANDYHSPVDTYFISKDWEQENQLIKEILEIHLVINNNNIPIKFNCSIHHQYSEIFNKKYVFQNKIDFHKLILLEELNFRTSDLNDNSFYFFRHFLKVKKISYYNKCSVLQGFEFISKMENLRSLELSVENYSSPMIDSIGDLKNLQELKLYIPKISNVDFIERNINLETLSIISKKIENFNFLKNLKKLEYIFIDIHKLTKNHPLFQLVSIKELRLINTVFVEDFNDFENFKNLKILDAFYIELNTIEFLKKIHLTKLNARKGTLSQDELDWIYANIEDVILL